MTTLESRMTCCGVKFVSQYNFSRHKQSVTHKTYPRIVALLKAECLTFKEIGERIGLSREYVRQIALRVNGVPRGYVRKTHCCIDQEGRKILDKKTLIGRFVAECSSRGLSWEPTLKERPSVVSKHSKYGRREIIVEGCLVRLRKAHLNCNGYISLHGYYGQRKSNLVRADVFAYELPDEHWLLLPQDQMTFKQTLFALDPNPERPGGKCNRHDYVDFIDKWWEVFQRGR